MKTSQCAPHIINWKTPQLPSVLSQAGADVVKTITGIGESNLDLFNRARKVVSILLNRGCKVVSVLFTEFARCSG